MEQNIYQPNYQQIDKIYIGQIVFEKNLKTVETTIFGYIFDEKTNKIVSCDYWCEMGTLTKLLQPLNKKGEAIIDAILDKINEKTEEYPSVIDVEEILKKPLLIEGISLNIYKPQEKDENGDWKEITTNNYIIEDTTQTKSPEISVDIDIPAKMGKIDVEFDFSSLSNLYLGKFGEQFIKLYFILNGIDTYEPLIDDKGIDFVARVSDEKFYDIQVKTIRLKKEAYVYFTKEKWKNKLRKNLLVAFVILQESTTPTLLLIPSTAWETETESKIFSDRNYEGKKSKPEWGIIIKNKNISYLIEKYEMTKILPGLKK